MNTTAFDSAKRRLLLAVAIGLATLPSARAAEPAWQTDVAKALAKARMENKKVLLCFTGSDWCNDCKNLQAEVLKTPEFSKYAATNFVLVQIDLLSSEESAAKEALVEKYEIRGWPTLVLLNPQGDALDKVVGYRKGVGPHVVIQDIEARRKKD